MRIRSVQSGGQTSRSNAVTSASLTDRHHWQDYLRDHQHAAEDRKPSDLDQNQDVQHQHLFTQLLDLATKRRHQAAGLDLHQIDLQLGMPDQGGQFVQIGLLDRRLSIALGFYLDQLYQQKLPELSGQMMSLPSDERVK